MLEFVRNILSRNSSKAGTSSSGNSSGTKSSGVSSNSPINTVQTWVCKKCREENPLTSSFCKGCGAYK